MMELIPGRYIGKENPSFIIAEIGQNHQGSFEIAKNLIDAARIAGADCVKFQKTNLVHKFTKCALKKPYRSPHSWGETYGEHKKHLEFSEEQFHLLKLYAESNNIAFTASAKDIASLEFLININVPFIKIGSGDSDDFLLLQAAAKCGKPLVISTGMQDMNRVREVYNMVKLFHTNFAILHCTSSYPTYPEDVNLRVIQTFQEEFPDISIGYSGHELGIVISIAAVSLGASIIERHITLNKNDKGSDHMCSLLPEEFKLMIKEIRIIEKALGNKNKRFLTCEIPCYEKLGKSLVAARTLLEGTILTEADIMIKVSHPRGIPAKDYQKIIGIKLKQNVLFDEAIQMEHMLFDNKIN